MMYVLEKQNTGSWTLIPNIPSTTRTKTGLSSGTVYEWQVRSACSSDSSSVSAWSSSEVFTTLIPCVSFTKSKYYQYNFI